jgi:hypothetical protein
MSKNQVSVNGQVGIKSMLENGLVHDYVLNDDKAKKIMISNAALPPLSAPDQTPQTSKLQLSTGSFSQVVQPLFNYWSTFNTDTPQKLVEGETEVTLKEVLLDTEQTNKKVDFLAKFEFQGRNISLFAYFTNQSLMVQGVPHSQFLELFLAPLLLKMISQKRDDIIAFNNKVKLMLTTKTKQPDQNDSVWALATPDRESLNVRLRRNTKCDICGRICPGVSQLKVHITNAHSGNTRAKPRGGNKSARITAPTIPRSYNEVNLLDSSDDEGSFEITFPLQPAKQITLRPPSPTRQPTPTIPKDKRRSSSSPGAVAPSPPMTAPPAVAAVDPPVVAPPTPPEVAPPEVAPVAPPVAAPPAVAPPVDPPAVEPSVVAPPVVATPVVAPLGVVLVSCPLPSCET